MCTEMLILPDCGMIYDLFVLLNDSGDLMFTSTLVLFDTVGVVD